MRRYIKRIIIVMAVLLGLWATAAYTILPVLLTHYEHQRGLAGRPMVTRTAQDIPGDPLNVGIVGTEAQLAAAMHAAGWFPADPVTLRTSIAIVGSVLLDRPYRDAPVSPLYYEGRVQDLSFELPLGQSPDSRMHVRFWKVLPSGQEGRPVWLGAATTDTGVGLSHYTGAVTHAIAPDVDATRDRLSAALADARAVLQTYRVSGVGPTLLAWNGEGDRYFTDGDIIVSVLAERPGEGVDPAPALSGPALVEFKNTVWQAIRALVPDR